MRRGRFDSLRVNKVEAGRLSTRNDVRSNMRRWATTLVRTDHGIQRVDLVSFCCPEQQMDWKKAPDAAVTVGAKRVQAGPGSTVSPPRRARQPTQAAQATTRPPHQHTSTGYMRWKWGNPPITSTPGTLGAFTCLQTADCRCARPCYATLVLDITRTTPSPSRLFLSPDCSHPATLPPVVLARTPCFRFPPHHHTLAHRSSSGLTT